MLLGTRLGLFSLHTDSAGGGLVFWHAKGLCNEKRRYHLLYYSWCTGAVIRRLIEDYWKQKHMEVQLFLL